jgi:hypothetical protein
MTMDSLQDDSANGTQMRRWQVCAPQVYEPRCRRDEAKMIDLWPILLSAREPQVK